REHPVPLTVCNERRLEVRSADRARIVRVLRELKRALDVFACGLVVALAAPAARAPREDVGAKRVGGHPRALGERKGLVQQTEGGLDAVQLVAADAECVEDFGALEIGERAGLDEPARLVQELEGLAQRAQPHLRASGADERANGELRNTGRPRRGDERLVLRGRVLVPKCFDQRLGSGQPAFETYALV